MRIVQVLLNGRKKVMLSLKKKDDYSFATKDLNPISSKFGFDRGTPIDRFWIDGFIEENQKYIQGRVLEIDDSRYSSKYPTKITKLDVLDINPNNKKANIHGDLRNLKDVISNNTYDCIILTHVLGMIDDLPKAVSELRRILKPGGVILVTSSCLSPVYDEENNFWRFTKASLNYLFKDGFITEVKGYGNVLAGQYFWAGLAQEELTHKELTYNDKRYPCVVSLIGIKK